MALIFLVIPVNTQEQFQKQIHKHIWNYTWVMAVIGQNHQVGRDNNNILA